MKNSANKNNGNALPSKSRANPLFTPHPKAWQIHYAMPPGKRQGGFGMDLNSRLLELEEIASRLEQGVGAVWAVALAAECAGDGCAKGLHGVWEYLSDAQTQLR